MKVRSFAKVNLWLRVVGKRPDGFHDIETVFHTLSLHDDIEVEASDGPAHVEMSIPGIDPANNLAAKAAHALTERAGRDLGARIKIDKDVPVGAGLAGGSGNAAATLLALNELWALGLSRMELSEIAAGIGSDVPFLLEGGTMLGWGRGEKLTRMSHADLWFVLGMSNEGLSTAEVYRRWLPEHSEGPPLDSFRVALGSGNAAEIAAEVRNDLEPAAFGLRPELAERKQAMAEAGALGALLSVSGPTVVGIAADDGSARAIAERVKDAFDRVEVVRSHPPAPL